MAVSGNDGRLYLLDGTSLKTPLHVTPKYSNAGATGGLATWESEGTRWILAPAVGAAQAGMKVAANGPVTSGSIVAFKLVDEGGKLSLEPAWASRDLTSPAAPLVFNGVVFALSTGEHRPANATATAAARAKGSLPAVLYALDPATGKELWSSGKTITSFARGGLSASAGQVYLVTLRQHAVRVWHTDGALTVFSRQSSVVVTVGSPVGSPVAVRVDCEPVTRSVH